MDDPADPFAFPDAAALAAIRKSVTHAGEGLRLPFRQRAWHGAAGNWAGVGIGSSIDFQDHRPYVPGDDPRYINWQAYARSGQYSMKLYREEVAPRVDLVIDCSPSMFAWPEKATRSLELLYFCADSARRHGASLQVYTVHGSGIVPIANAALDHRDANAFRPQFPASEHTPEVDRIPWRRGAMRVFVSDVLYPGDPNQVTAVLAHGGPAIFLAPWHQREAKPDWQGNLELVDAETGAVRPQLVDRRLAERYREAYNRHVAAWAESARRHNAVFARVASSGELTAALLAEGLAVGACEQCN